MRDKSTLEKTLDSVEGPLLFLTVVVMLMCVAWTILHVPSWMVHASSTANLSQVNARIEVYEKEYKRTVADISILKEGSGIRFNADKPIESLVNARLAISKDIISEKIKRQTLLADILARCNGPFKFTVWLHDDVTCDQYRVMK